MTLKEEYRQKTNELLRKHEVFWAFNEEQLREGINKYNISKDNKMVNIGMGGYMPSKYLSSYLKETEELYNWYKSQLKELRKSRAELEKVILYELNNYECFYTGDIDDACEALPTVSRKEVLKVYKKHRGSRD